MVERPAVGNLLLTAAPKSLEMSLRALWAADTAAPDLRYRIAKVRVWGDATKISGFQFFYRHYWSGEERDGQPVATNLCDFSLPPILEVDLIEEEFIVALEGLRDTTDVSTINGLLLATSMGRHFKVGGALRRDLIVNKTTTGEVRGIETQQTPDRRVYVSISPTVVAFPTMETIKATLNEIDEAVKTKWWYPERCDQLAAKLVEVLKVVELVISRGVVYPVGLICEFAELAVLGKAVIISCVQPLSVDYFIPRGLVIDGYIDHLALIAVAAKDRVQKAELASLENGDPFIVLDDQSTPKIVRHALKSHRMLAIELCCKYPEHLASDQDYVYRIIEALIETDENLRIIDVVEANARTVKSPVSAIMARYKRRQPSLIERAVHWGRPQLLEWLISAAGMDPFSSSEPESIQLTDTPSSDALVIVDRDGDTSAKRQTQYENLMDAAEHTQDKDAQVRMQTLLKYMKQKDDFQTGLVTLSTQDAVTAQQFQELVPMITSVYDLPLLFSQARTHLHDDGRAFSALVRCTCDHVIENKLVLDTKASAFFNVALRQASERGHLSPLEHEHYRIINSQINMETAPWVIELKRATDQIQWRVNRLDDQVESLQRNIRNLRESMRRNEEIELNRRRCRRNLALFSTMLSMVGGQAVFALQDMFEPVDPTLLTASEDDILEVFKDAARGFLAPGSSGSDFDRSLSGLTRMLQEEPEIEPSEFMGLDFVRDLGCENEKALEIIGVLTTAAELCKLKTVVQVKRVTFDERQIWLHPYHNAVRQSRGDLQQFKELELALRGKTDVNDEFEITVTKVHDDGATTTKTAPMPAYIYASHLGYLDIVDHLLANCSLRKREWKLTTRRRARKAKANTSPSGSRRPSH